MPQSIPLTRSLSLGAAAVTIINVGDMTEFLKDWIILPESDRPADYARVFEQPMHVPVQCVHITLNGRSILVDAGKFDPPGEPIRPRLTDGLAAIGVKPADITDVVITHAHWDHYNATTALRDGDYAPQFPNARYFFGRADCESILNGEAIRDAGSVENQTLGVLNRAGLLAPVEGDLDLDLGVRIIAAPGETAGHQMLRVRSGGYTLFCLGDLYHHPIEVERPEWMVNWAIPGPNLASRAAFGETALASNALLIATHIPGVGRAHATGSGVVWVGV